MTAFARGCHAGVSATRTIPLNQTALELLKHKYAGRSIETELVFPSEALTRLNASNISRSLTIALKKAKMTDFHFHDLRHTCATRMVQAGVDLYKVQRLLGHKSPIMTQRYAHTIRRACGMASKCWMSGEKLAQI